MRSGTADAPVAMTAASVKPISSVSTSLPPASYPEKLHQQNPRGDGGGGDADDDNDDNNSQRLKQTMIT